MAEPTRTPEEKLPAAPAAPEETLPWLEELPPRKIVAELDRYIVGQEVAKKAVAIAVRNRDRKSTRLNSSHSQISYALFCLKKNDMQTLTGKGRACNPIWPDCGNVPFDTDNLAPRVGFASYIGDSRRPARRTEHGTASDKTL